VHKYISFYIPNAIQKKQLPTKNEPLSEWSTTTSTTTGFWPSNAAAQFNLLLPSLGTSPDPSTQTNEGGKSSRRVGSRPRKTARTEGERKARRKRRGGREDARERERGWRVGERMVNEEGEGVRGSGGDAPAVRRGAGEEGGMGGEAGEEGGCCIFVVWGPRPG